MREYLLVLGIAAAVTFLTSALCRRLALRIGAMARVRDRDVHTIEMPYFGGIAMLTGQGNGELAFVFFAAYLALFFSGAGKLSVDAKIGART